LHRRARCIKNVHIGLPRVSRERFLELAFAPERFCHRSICRIVPTPSNARTGFPSQCEVALEQQDAR